VGRFTSLQLLNHRVNHRYRATMSTVVYAAFASIVALVPIFYIWSRYRRRAASRPSIQLEVFPAASPPSGPLVVVTGGSGFVGRRIIELLLQEPEQYRVAVLDVLLPVFKHPSVTYVRGDICDPAHVEAAFKGADAVLHVASIIPSLKTQASPIIHRVNVDGTRVVIDACKVSSPHVSS
jgi:FlaA1/EpsC-like NDP-sugar epimerase